MTALPRNLQAHGPGLSRHGHAETSQLQSIVANELGLPPDEVRPESSLTDNLQLDFFDLSELAEALEVALSTSISDEALHSFQTVGDIDRYLRTSLHTADAPELST